MNPLIQLKQTNRGPEFLRGKSTLALSAAVVLLIGGMLTLVFALVIPVSADPRPTDPDMTSNTLVLVPYEAMGYRFFPLQENDEVPQGFEQPDFDDSGFPPGKAGFGSGGDCPLQQTRSTDWMVNSRLLIRRTVSVPMSATNVRIMLAVDNDVTHLYFNGHLIASNIHHAECPVRDEVRIDVDPSLVERDERDNVIAFELLDRGDESFFDARVLADLPDPAIDKTESIVRALQSSTAPVYDRNGMRCDVPAIPPPSPHCFAVLTCPTPNTPPAQCDIVYVMCPDFTCPTTPPPPPPPDPPAPPTYTNTRPGIPVNPLRECGWPVITLSNGIFGDGLESSNGEFGVRMSVVKNETGLGGVQWRLPVLADDAPVGCFPPTITGPPEPLPDDVAAAGIPVSVWKGLSPAEKDFVKRHPSVAADFYQDSLLARRETQDRWRNEEFRDVNGPENAFQHAFWNALMAWGHGIALAKEFADAHENRPNNPPCEKDMDLFNNDKGRPIGSSTSQWVGNVEVADAVYYACIVQKKCTWITGPGATPCP